jgi:hypothetical protein
MDALFKSTGKVDEGGWGVFLKTYCECAIWFSMNGSDAKMAADWAVKILKVLVSAHRYQELLGRIEFEGFPKGVAGFIVKIAGRMDTEISGLFESVLVECTESLYDSKHLGVNCERVGRFLNEMNLAARSCGNNNVVKEVKELCEKVQTLTLVQLNSGGMKCVLISKCASTNLVKSCH